MHDESAIWFAQSPAVWPAPPEVMSVSRLLDIETCPRRWALNSANYPELWSGSGYPERIRPWGLEGQIIHRTLERIIGVLHKSGCTSVNSDAFFKTMLVLGGYSQLLETAIEHEVVRQKSNPRANRNLAKAKQQLHKRLPQMRLRLQMLVSRLALYPASKDDGQHPSTRPATSRVPLTYGSHSEVQLHAPSLGWKGFADFINVSGEECEILDFKTGSSKVEHEFQVRIYALLWALDSEINPRRQPTTKLTIAYVDGEIDVRAPSPNDLNDLEKELKERTTAAFMAIHLVPPEARPSVAACSYCQVRQLCNEYWDPKTQLHLAAENATFPATNDGRTVDLQVNDIARLGPTMWSGTVESSALFAPGSRTSIRASQADPILLEILASSKRMRILDAYTNSGSEGWTEAPTVSVSTNSEGFTF